MELSIAEGTSNYEHNYLSALRQSRCKLGSVLDILESFDLTADEIEHCERLANIIQDEVDQLVMAVNELARK